MAVTREQILAAADQIAAAGQRPTLSAIRQITGGSYTTISPVLADWKAKQAVGSAPAREPAPSAVTDRLTEVAAEVWALAVEMANARLASEREALDKVRVDLEASQAEATELADKLTAELESLNTRLGSADADLAAARAEVGALREQVAGLNERAHAAEARAVEIERRAGDLRVELDRAHQEADQARTALAAQQKLTDAAAADRDAARKDAAQAREGSARLAGQLQAQQEQVAALLARLEPTAPSKPSPRK
jgi:chromosome segregation ATPase